MKSYVLVLAIAACGPSGSNGADTTPDASSGPDATAIGSGSGSGSGSGNASYPVYAHSDTTLYTIDLATNALVTIGSFATPDVITDLAVAPSGTIFVNGEASLFTASPVDGHVTRVGSLATCGQRGVALTTTADGRMWIGDYLGAICQIDLSGASPVVKPPVMLSDGYALAGDMVGIDNGTVFGTVYKLNDSTTTTNNLLAKIDVETGAVTVIGPSGYPRLYGAAFQENKVFAFTHDGSGRVVTIDTTTGAGTMFGTFKDPSSTTGIAFAGAGVNPLVTIQ